MGISKKQLAIFSNAMYKKNSLNHVNDNVKGDWILDKAKSKVDSKVFVNEKNKSVVVGFRGTKNLKDVKDDINIVLGTESKSKRWKKARKLVEKVNEQYKGYKVYVTGHSLGGSLAEFSSRKTGNKTDGYSRGTMKVKQAIKNPKYVDVYNKYDPTSGLVRTHKGGKKKNVRIKGINKHSLKGFV